MNKKGFTLTELLAVIAIIAVVSLIGTVSITGIKAKIDENMFDSKLQLAIGAAEKWGQDNKESLSGKTLNGITGKSMTFGELIGTKYLESDEGEKFNDHKGNDVKDKADVLIYKKNGRVYACIWKYQTSASKSIAQNYACDGVTF